LILTLAPLLTGVNVAFIAFAGEYGSNRTNTGQAAQ
jgi:hypothetical protein